MGLVAVKQALLTANCIVSTGILYPYSNLVPQQQLWLLTVYLWWRVDAQAYRQNMSWFAVRSVCLLLRGLLSGWCCCAFAVLAVLRADMLPTGFVVPHSGCAVGLF
jgi:hypothetical protein